MYCLLPILGDGVKWYMLVSRFITGFGTGIFCHIFKFVQDVCQFFELIRPQLLYHKTDYLPSVTVLPPGFLEYLLDLLFR